MILLTIGLIIVIVMFYNFSSLFQNITDWLFGIIFLIMGWAIILFFAFLISAFAGLFLPQTEKLQQSYPIVSLRDGIGIQGNSFLISGSLNDTPKFYFYKQLQDGGYQLDSIQAGLVNIYQSTTEKPRVEMWGDNFTNSWLWLIALPTGIWSQRYKIYVPSNSIVQEYNLNLSK